MALPYSNQDVSAVLYQNAEKTVTLLDIPTSVSLAQGTAEHPCTNRIYSLHPPQAPYPSIEPKSENARANVLQTKRDPDVDFPEVLLHQALVGIAEYANGDWCLQRKISPLAVQRRSKVSLFGAIETSPSTQEHQCSLLQKQRATCHPLYATETYLEVRASSNLGHADSKMLNSGES